MAENDVPIPSYDDIFCPHEPKLREPNRMYGNKLLEMYFDEQHRVLLDNYRMKKTTNDAHGTAKKENAGTIALKGSTVETASSIELVDVSPKLCDDVGKETHVDCMPLVIQNQVEGTSRVIGSLKMYGIFIAGAEEFQFEDLNLDNVDGSFPSFGALLSNGNVKRVKAIREQRESLLSDMPLKLGYETVDFVSSSCQANNHEASRKSTRERKDEKCIAGDTSNVCMF
ncbi:hypothetical protein GOP47_0010252 [Adiantum capillus-veneris]|uniref:Uncharacterized protein n=1 Tax=Adiantum capillus-veneris TaxID=13818 RepID=A0A9D4ZIK9_ADICA|nr:hypothetical protein GOP47_0010252 [Adiantum capillus-veneris]